MHRIDGPGATVTGQWTRGNRSTGVPATQFTDDWCNAVQNEIENVIVTGAGGTLNKANNAQMLAAILTIISKNLIPESFTVAGLPAAASNTRRIVYVSNESGGAVLAFSDGTSWRRVTDRVVVS